MVSQQDYLFQNLNWPSTTYFFNSAHAVFFVIIPWHLNAPHQISLWHAVPLTRAAVTAGTNVQDPLPITALFIKWEKAVSKQLGVGISGDGRLWVLEGRKDHFDWEQRLIGPHGSDVIIIRDFIGLKCSHCFFTWTQMVQHTSWKKTERRN